MGLKILTVQFYPGTPQKAQMTIPTLPLEGWDKYRHFLLSIVDSTVEPENGKLFLWTEKSPEGPSFNFARQGSRIAKNPSWNLKHENYKSSVVSFKFC